MSEPVLRISGWGHDVLVLLKLPCSQPMVISATVNRWLQHGGLLMKLFLTVLLSAGMAFASGTTQNISQFVGGRPDSAITYLMHSSGPGIHTLGPSTNPTVWQSSDPMSSGLNRLVRLGSPPLLDSTISVSAICIVLEHCFKVRPQLFPGGLTRRSTFLVKPTESIRVNRPDKVAPVWPSRCLMSWWLATHKASSDGA